MAALNRKIARTSLLPSRKIDEPWPLTLRNRAADAALTTMPLSMVVSHIPRPQALGEGAPTHNAKAATRAEVVPDIAMLAMPAGGRGF